MRNNASISTTQRCVQYVQLLVWFRPGKVNFYAHERLGHITWKVDSQLCYLSCVSDDVGKWIFLLLVTWADDRGRVIAAVVLCCRSGQLVSRWRDTARDASPSPCFIKQPASWLSRSMMMFLLLLLLLLLDFAQTAVANPPQNSPEVGT